MLYLFNTLSRRKEPFKAEEQSKVKIYTCGPTVYAPPHIGNYRYFLFTDLLRRYLEYKGYNVYHVINITDIDDKTIRDSAKENLMLKDFTKKYEQVFFDGIDFLNILRASAYPRATENIDEMIKITMNLIDKKYAYEKEGSIYFDVSSFKNYGRLSKIDLKNIKTGIRTSSDEYAKDSPADFALMKKSNNIEVERGITYHSQWGNVRPGWHIECSAIGIKYLGPSFDIHTGGIDLIFPHHENEKAQSEAYTGIKFVNYWIHCEHLLVNGQKMSKSLGNIITLQDLIEKGYDPRVIRLLLISTHYRKKINFTIDVLNSAEQTLKKIISFINRLQEIKSNEFNLDIDLLIETTQNEFFRAMDNDLNISKALNSLYDLISKINKLFEKKKLGKNSAKKIIDFFFKIDKIIGLRLDETENTTISEEALTLIKNRELARTNGDWEIADKIRLQLKKIGIDLEDTPSGVKWIIKGKK